MKDYSNLTTPSFQCNEDLGEKDTWFFVCFNPVSLGPRNMQGCKTQILSTPLENIMQLEYNVLPGSYQLLSSLHTSPWVRSHVYNCDSIILLLGLKLYNPLNSVFSGYLIWLLHSHFYPDLAKCRFKHSGIHSKFG